MPIPEASASPDIRAALREFILTNELAGSPGSLAELLRWLEWVADDFEARGADTADIRAVMRRIEGERRRRQRIIGGPGGHNV